MVYLKRFSRQAEKWTSVSHWRRGVVNQIAQAVREWQGLTLVHVRAQLKQL
jgi:hypothetical protein